MSKNANRSHNNIGRSPSWGAWIEISVIFALAWPKYRRSPSWGAWIEILILGASDYSKIKVAPPRGERGLKYSLCQQKGIDPESRSPSWGAWIEMIARRRTYASSSGRSPSWGAWIEINGRQWRPPPAPVAPPRGERGLKWHLQILP